MADTTANAIENPPQPKRQSPSQDVTVMDLWLTIREYRNFGTTVVVLGIFLGLAIAFYLPPTHEFTTAIEIGNQFVGGEEIPIEASITVSDKLETGYIPLIASQFVQQNPDGPDEYVVEVQSSENSQIVWLLSEAPSDQRDLISNFHNQVVQELVEDHNRTVDPMRASQEVALSEAEKKLGETVAQDHALTEHLESISDTLVSLEDYEVELSSRIDSAEADIKRLRSQGNAGGDWATQILMLSNQIGEWRTVLVGIENQNVSIFAIRAATQVKLEINAKEQKIAQDDIEFRKTNIQNIQATRALGQGTVMSLKPVAPNKPLILVASLIIAALTAIAGALVLDFLQRAGQTKRNQA